jgi:hypothetical protein
MLLFPNRCIPLAATIAGVTANALSLKQKLLDYYQKIEDEVRAAMAVVNELMTEVSCGWCRHFFCSLYPVR